MSNRDTLIQCANAWSEAECGSALDVLGVPRGTNTPVGYTIADVPGAPPCLAHLTGKFVGPYWQSVTYAIAEVRDTFPIGSLEYQFLAKNIERANQLRRMSLGMIGVCFPLGANGELDLSGTGLPHTYALPSEDTNNGPGYPTVESAQARYGTLDEPVTSGGSGFGPHS